MTSLFTQEVKQFHLITAFSLSCPTFPTNIILNYSSQTFPELENGHFLPKNFTFFCGPSELMICNTKERVTLIVI